MIEKLTVNQKKEIYLKEKARYNGFKAMNLKLDMSRGKPCKEQLDLSMGLLDTLNSGSTLKGALDYRNYGILDGIPELKKLFGELAGCGENEIIIGGNSSLNLMYDTVQRAMQFGVLGGEPFNKQGKVKWICPVPGYDRHFGVTEAFGIEMINVNMTEEGPDTDAIAELIKDPAVKGMWCVPKYSNPQGIVYSDRVVKFLASMKPAAADFRIYWDNAYMIHGLTDNDIELTDILCEAKKAGNPDIVYIFGSSSKVTFPGAGVSFIISSEANIASFKKMLANQTIGSNKVNQYAHYLFFRNVDSIKKHMKKHADVIKPKFDMVCDILADELSDIASFKKPDGGYFISCDLPYGTAKRTVQLAKEAGVIFTPAGSTFPYKKDPEDKNVRIAPTLPPIDELELAMRVFCCAAKIAYFEKDFD